MTIHNNEFEKFKIVKEKKKPKWMNEETKPFYHTFSQSSQQRSKKRYLVEKKLELTDCNIELFEKKYDHSPDLVHVFDISGQTIWINKTLKELFFEEVEEVYLLPLFQHWVDTNKEKPEVQKEMKFLMEECPKTFEFCNVAFTSYEEHYFKVFFVISILLKIGKN